MPNLVLVELADPVDLVGPPVDRVAGQVVVLTVDLHSRSSRINGSLLTAKVLRLYLNPVAAMVAPFLLAQ
jgi:hypothetical protein